MYEISNFIQLIYIFLNEFMSRAVGNTVIKSK